MTEERFLRLVNGCIGMKGVLKRRLAEVCGVTPSQMSNYLHGYRPIPPEIREKLLKELNMANTVASLGPMVGPEP